MSGTADPVAEKLAVLEALEQALARSSSKLAELLSLIGVDDEQQPPPSPVAWIAADPDAPEGLGRVMISWPAAPAETLIGDAPRMSQLAGVIDADNPIVAANITISSGRAANDNTVWVGDDGLGGLYGREPSVATLPDGKTVIAWIGEENIVHAALYPAEAARAAEQAYAADEGVSATAEPTLFQSLGEAAPAEGKDETRLKVAPNGPSSFTAVWVAEFGIAAALASQILTREADALGRDGADGHASEPGWEVKPLPPVPVTGSGVRDLTIAFNDTGGLIVGYSSADGNGQRSTSSVSVDVAAADGAMAGDEDGQWASDRLAEGGAGLTDGAEHGVEAAPDDPGEGAADPQDATAASGEDADRAGDSVKDAGAPDALAPHLRLAGTFNDMIAQTMPNVAVTADGAIIVLRVEAGAEPGTSTITVAVVDETGTPVAGADGAPRVIEVTDQAITTDSAHPDLDLDPDIAAIGSGTGVAWVQSSGDGHTGAKQLVVQLYDGDGKAVTGDPVVVSVTEGETSTISDIDLAGISASGPGQSGDRGRGGAPDATKAAAAASQADLAIVWVKDADPNGYGAVELQLFSVDQPDEAEGPAKVQPLGRDGGDDGDNAPFQVARDEAPAVGRDPKVEGVRGGAIAVAWVAPGDGGSAPEVVTGVVIDSRDGSQLVALDLTPFMSNGLADGTEPTLQATLGGDIVVGWVQLDSGGGYSAEAAIYKFVSDGMWTRPAETVRLATFDDIPDRLSIIVTGTSDPSLIVTWREDGDLIGNRFGLDGEQIGDTFDLSTGNSCPRHRDDTYEGGLAAVVSGTEAAALPDANFVVVYTQVDGGDAGIGAKIYAADGTVAVASPIALAAGAPNLTAEQVTTVASVLAAVTVAASDTGTASTGQPGDAQPATAVEADLDRDVLTVISTDGTADIALLSSDLTAASGDGPSASDIAAAIEIYTGGGSDAGTVPAGGEAAVAVEAASETLSYATGFGNDAPDAALAVTAEPDSAEAGAVAAAFDALQFANALYVEVNQDVIVFDTTNVVVIRTNTPGTPPDEALG